MTDSTSVGVLLGERSMTKIAGEVHQLQALISANSSVGADLFFFTLKDVDFRRQTIIGRYSKDGKSWQSKTRAYPAAFYRRYSVPMHQESIFNKFLRQLIIRGTVFLNYQFSFDKWKLHCALSDTDLREHLPETRLVKSLSQLAAMLDQHAVLYLKACTGGKGKEVLRVEKISNSYFYSYFRNQLHRGKTTRSALADLIRSFFAQQDFIAQQAIDLLQVNGRNVDFRAEVQPAPNAPPHVSVIPVRIAAIGSPITTHSISMSMDKFCREYAQSLALFNGSLRQQAEDFSTKVFQAVVQKFGYGAELGIDFGVDKAGKFWLIECNAQSAKVSLFNSYSPKEVEQTYINLLNYAVAKAGTQDY